MGETAVRLAVRLPAAGRRDGLGYRRDLVGRHLRRVYGDAAPGPSLCRRVDESFASFGRYWAENLRLSSLGRERILAGMRYEGYEHLRQGEAAGRGTILALPHLGGWEWAGAHLGLTGHAISVVVEALEPPELFEWFATLRTRLGMRVIPTGPGVAAACGQALVANHLLCLLCDRIVAGAAGVEVEFFGERTLLPAGPVTLALRTGAALLPCAVYFGAGADDHLGVIRPPLELRRAGRFRDDIQAGTQALAREMEALIRRAPTQWHLLQPNWPSDPAPGRGAPRSAGPVRRGH